MNELERVEAKTSELVESALSVEGLIEQVRLIQNVMKSVMKDGEHYGTIEGTKKPSLFKPGAEKLSFIFRLAPEYDIDITDLERGHREYRVKCRLRHIPTGKVMGEGVGSCTTLEGKYRYRGGERIPTERPIPKEYWNLRKEGKIDEAQELIGGPGYGPMKHSGRWVIAEIGEKAEYDNPADFWNTCLKMSKKRAHVDAILTATAASDIFTQDDIPVQEEKADQPPPYEMPREREIEQDVPESIVENETATEGEQGSAKEKQLKAIASLLNRLGITEEYYKRQAVANILGRGSMETFRHLSESDAATVIGKLNELVSKAGK